jgi:hypothetical protein
MRTLVSILLAVSLAAGMATAQQNLCYSWEDGGTILGSYAPDLLYVANTTDQAFPDGGSRSLEIYKSASGTTPQAYVAWITDLQTGDEVTASIQTLDFTEGSNPSVRIWAHYTSAGGDVNSYAGSASGPAGYSGGPDWVELSHTWVHPSGRDGEGLVIEIRPYNSDPYEGSNWVDYLCVIAPNHTTINFPSGGFNQPPVVSNVYHRPLLPQNTNTVTVYADAVDNDGTIAGVTLYYRVNAGSDVSVPMSLQTGDTYAGTIPAQADGSVVEYYVEAEDDGAELGRSPGTGYYSYTVGPEVITPIGTIHDDYDTYDGEIVKVQGQLYIPGDHRGTGDVSAYIQGADGRGLSIYGDIRSTGMDLLNDVDHIVKVSGRVSKYFTTVQLQNYEVELVSAGNPPLVPVTLSTADAALLTNEGTYIKSLGVIQAKAETGSGVNLAYNFTIDDGSGPVIVRVYENVLPGVMQDWLVGEMLEAAGAGASYSGDGQIIVGLASDLNHFADTIAPTLESAVLFLPDKVRLEFSEPVDATTSQSVFNYYVHETADYNNFVSVVDAELQTANPSIVILTLAQAIDGTAHTVEVYDVEDLAGNPVDPNPSSAPISEQLMQTLCYGWENGETALGVYAPDLLFLDNTTAEAYEGSRSLEIYKNADGTTPQAFVAWIVDLQTGDEVGASLQVLDPIVGNPRLRIWGHWTTPGGDVNSYAGSAGGNPNYSSGLGVWEELGHTWTVPVDKDGHGLIVEVRPYNSDPFTGSNWVDDLCVTAPMHSTIVFPGGLSDAPVPTMVTALKANYPNPFNPMTTFSFSLEHDTRVELSVFDLRGRKVRTVVDAPLTAGDYTNAYRWDGRDDQGRMMTSGTYFYRLTTDDGHVESRKMTLLK